MHVSNDKSMYVYNPIIYCFSFLFLFLILFYLFIYFVPLLFCINLYIILCKYYKLTFVKIVNMLPVILQKGVLHSNKDFQDFQDFQDKTDKNGN